MTVEHAIIALLLIVAETYRRAWRLQREVADNFIEALDHCAAHGKAAATVAVEDAIRGRLITLGSAAEIRHCRAVMRHRARRT